MIAAAILIAAGFIAGVILTMAAVMVATQILIHAEPEHPTK